MTIFSLYFPILLSLSISFFLHIFKKHVHSFYLLLTTTFKNIININTTKNNCHDPIIKHTNGSLSLSMNDGMNNNLMCVNEIGVNDDRNDKNENNDDDDDDDKSYWRRKRVNELKQMFPPPISSLNQKGQPNFVLVPMRNNGRLQLQKVRIKRPEILHSSREGGRLKMYLIPNHYQDNVEEEKNKGEEDEQQFVEQELVQEEAKEKVERIVESEEEEEKESREEMRNEKEDDYGIVKGWRFPLEDHNKIEGFRRCHHVHGGQRCHHNVHMYGVILA